jgi:hypothetical protein
VRERRRPAPLAIPFAGAVYRHVLTLLFVDARSGADVYCGVGVAARSRCRFAARRVCARDERAGEAAVRAGRRLAREDEKDDAGAMPGVVSVKPAAAR